MSPESNEHVIQMIETAGFDTQNNPDYIRFEFTDLLIDHVRQIKNISARKPYGDKMFIVISANTLTKESQNALLKSFEDTPSTLVYFLLVTAPNQLIDTLRSRLHFLDTKSENKNDVDVQGFFKLPVAERVSFVEKLSLSENNQEIRDFVIAIEKYASKTNSLSSVQKKLILDSSQLLTIKGSRKKLILQDLALSLGNNS